MAPDADVDVFGADSDVVAVCQLEEEELGDSDARGKMGVVSESVGGVLDGGLCWGC